MNETGTKRRAGRQRPGNTDDHPGAAMKLGWPKKRFGELANAIAGHRRPPRVTTLMAKGALNRQ